MLQEIEITKLKDHPRNKEFFDDMTGEKWEEFLESIRTSGVIEPIIVTQDLMIVSGHQRKRACEALDIPKVSVMIKYYESEDEILKELLETNIRQRGDVGGSAKKIGRRILELERIYGIKHGNNQHDRTSQNVNSSISQEDLAEMIGMSVMNLNRYKQLATAIPELDSLLTTGKVTKTTALAIMKELSEEDQREFIASLPSSDSDKKYTKSEVENMIAGYKAEISAKENVISEANYTLDNIKRMNKIIPGFEDMIDTGVVSKSVAENIVNMLSDEEAGQMKIVQSQITKLNNQLRNLREENEEYNDLKNKVQRLTLEYDGILHRVNAAKEVGKFIFDIDNFIEKTLAPSLFKDYWRLLQDNPDCYQSMQACVEKVIKWANEIENAMNIQEVIVNG